MISNDALEAVEVETPYEYYGYCHDLLVKLNVREMRVADVSMPAVYGEEEPSIAHAEYIPQVSTMLLRNINFAIAFGAIAIMVVAILTAGIPLPVAVVGHEGSTVLVSLIGLRLLRFTD